MWAHNISSTPGCGILNHNKEKNNNFRQYYAKSSILNARIACVICIIVYVMFSITDYVANCAYPTANYSFQAFVCLYLLLTFALSFTKIYCLIHNILVSSAVSLFMGGFIFLNISHNYGYNFRDILPIIVLPYILHHFLCISVIYTAGVCFVLQSLYSISMPLFYGFNDEYILVNLYLAVSSVFAIIISFKSERRIRQEFNELTMMPEQIIQMPQTSEDCCYLKNLFLASMTHELKEPINGIWGSLQALSETSLNKAQRNNIRIMRDCSHHLVSLTDNILDMSKMQGKIVVEEELMNICDIVEEAVEVISATAVMKRLKVSSFISSCVPDSVVGDPYKLRQILINLLSNAVKFTNQGEIHVNVSIEMETDSTWTICFKVSDTGIGITPEEIPFLWSRFKRDSKFGLLLVDQLTQLLNGDLSVSSVPHSGSTFQFLLSFSKFTSFPSPSPSFSPSCSPSRSPSCSSSSRFAHTLPPFPSPPSLPYGAEGGELLIPQEMNVLVLDSSEYVCDTICAYMQDASPRLCVDSTSQAHTCVEFCGIPASSSENALHLLSLRKFSIVIINDWLEEPLDELLAEIETNPFMTSTQLIYAYQDSPPSFISSFPSLPSRCLFIRLPFKRSSLVKCLYRCAHSALFGYNLLSTQEEEEADESCACHTTKSEREETVTPADLSPSPSPPASPLSTRTISVFTSFNSSPSPSPSSPSSSSPSYTASFASPPALSIIKKKGRLSKLNEAFIASELSTSSSSLNSEDKNIINNNKDVHISNNDMINTGTNNNINHEENDDNNEDNSESENTENSISFCDAISLSSPSSPAIC